MEGDVAKKKVLLWSFWFGLEDGVGGGQGLEVVEEVALYLFHCDIYYGVNIG